MSSNSAAAAVFAPFQESEVISNKTDNDGHHYLKVLLLSNKKSRNNWIAPYKRIGDLPKEVIDSFIGLPRIDEHSYPYFVQLKDKLERQGKPDDEIVAILKAESQKLGLDYIDHVFMNDPNSSLLYGQQKIMDKKVNEYIKTHNNKLPDGYKPFTSPGVYGTCDITPDGTDVYHIDTLRAFHLAGVDIPAFEPEDAKIKGVCSGNSDSCKKVLAVAGFDSSNYPDVTTPTENVNNNCSCNKSIDNNMSQQTPEVTKIDNVNITPEAPIAASKLLNDYKNSTAEAVEAARKEAAKVVEETNKAKEQENKSEAQSEVEKQLKQATKELELAQNEKNEMKSFFIEKLLIAAIPRESFQKEEEFNNLKDSAKGLILKYNMNLEDADWFISKVAKSVPHVSTVEEKKETTKKSVGVAGFIPTSYNSDFLTTSQRKAPQPQSSAGNNSEFSDEDYSSF